MTMQMTSASPVWRPFTQMKTAPESLKVTRGDGVYIELEDGRRLIDCISSWWVNIHGHANPTIASAIYEQAKKLEHVIFAGFTHAPAEQLAANLLEQLPNSLRRVFYSDNGSTAVEVALKMAVQFWHNQGLQKTRLLAFDGGYHGDTLGAMSVGRSSPFYQPFQDLLCSVDIVPYPHTFDNDESVSAHERESLDALTALAERNAGQYAAIIIEPLVQGAAGMRMCRPQFLSALRRLADELGILVIYDEVMTGFGRTGEWFACRKSNTRPDIICLSKGITVGFLPLSATVTSETVYQAFYSDNVMKTFFHGHSYTANPLACAAAVASYDLLNGNPNVFREAEQRHREQFKQHLAGHRLLRHHRFCGTIAAFDLTTADGTNYFDRIGETIKQRSIKNGLLIRPLGNTIYLMPPYCITEEQLSTVYVGIAAVLDSL